VVLVLLAVVLVGVLAAVGLLVWAFSGGWDGLRGQADPHDRAVTAARDGSRDDLDALTRETLGAVGGRELARVRFDGCRQGENNWKIHDGYTLRCEMSDSVVLAPTGAGDVTAVAAELDQALQRAGWRPLGVRNEMTVPADPNLSYLRGTRTGHYERGDERHQLDVEVTVRADSRGTADLPYDSSTSVEGDVSAYRAALTPRAGTQPGSREPRLVVHTALRYFEDD
jgi:hypothetical protein